MQCTGRVSDQSLSTDGKGWITDQLYKAGGGLQSSAHCVHVQLTDSIFSSLALLSVPFEGEGRQGKRDFCRILKINLQRIMVAFQFCLKVNVPGLNPHVLQCRLLICLDSNTLNVRSSLKLFRTSFKRA